MTTPNKPAHALATDLEQALFRLYDLDNQPDIEFTENGPKWGTTFHNAETANLAPAINVAELRLEAFLRSHRTELADLDKWHTHYAHYDENDSRIAEQTLDAPASNREDLDPVHAYTVEVHATDVFGAPDTALRCDTLTDAYVQAIAEIEHRIPDMRTAVPALVAIYRDNETPSQSRLLYPSDRILPELHHRIQEHTAAIALVRTQAALQEWFEAHRGITENESRIAAWLDHTDPARESLDGMPFEYLAARWAVHEVIVSLPWMEVPNPWKEQLQQAGIDPRHIYALADTPDTMVFTARPSDPAARDRDNALRSLLVQHTQELVQVTGIPSLEDLHAEGVDAFRYTVEITGPFARGVPDTTIECATLTDAYAYLFERFDPAHCGWRPQASVIVQITAPETDNPYFLGVDTVENLFDQIKSQAFEHAAASAYLLAHNALRQWQHTPCGPSGWQPTSDTRMRTLTPGADVPVSALSVDDIVARWAVAETLIVQYRQIGINPWTEPMRAAGFQLSRVADIADYIAYNETITRPEHPAARQRDDLLRTRVNQLIEQLTQPAPLADRAAQIRQLLTASTSEHSTTALAADHAAADLGPDPGLTATTTPEPAIEL